MDNNHPVRRRPAHPPPVERLNRPVILFVTLCIQPRSRALDNDVFHCAWRRALAEADAWSVGSYVIMPDHVHLFCCPATYPPTGIKPWTVFVKRLISRHLGAHPWQWQSDCWDTQIRDADHFAERTHCVRMNPVRAGLAEHPDQWPYQGVIRTLQW